MKCSLKTRCVSALKSMIRDKDMEHKNTIVDNIVERLTDKNIDVYHKLVPICLTPLTDPLYIKNDSLYTDVEFFDGYNDVNKGKQTIVFEKVHNTQLSGGRCVSRSIYSHPICNPNVLKARGEVLKRYEHIYAQHGEEIDALIAEMKEYEKYVKWLHDEVDENIQSLYDMVFFRLKGLKPLNKSEHALSAYNLYRILLSPLFGLVAPLVYFIIPYIVVLYKFKVRVPFKLYMKLMIHTIFTSEETMFGNVSGKWYKYIRIISYLFTAIFYFQGVLSSVDVSRTVNKISKLIVDNVSGVVKYARAASKLNNLLWRKEDMALFFVPGDKIFDNEKENAYVSTLSDTKYSLFSNFGRQLKMYRELDMTYINSVVAKSYMLDSLIGAMKYKMKNKYSYTTVSNSSTACMQFLQMEHPCINKEHVVGNDIDFGLQNRRNAIITSPNSSGKSVLIKSIIVNVLSSQTMGISFSKDATLTPFSYISTQMNVPDTTGYESLFEAEMHRCKANLDQLKMLKDLESKSGNRPLSLIVMDEIFNSTNPIEAISGAYAVCNKIANYETNILIFTTHLGYLTKLAKGDSSFENYRMQTSVNGSDIRFSYKFEKGVNKHLLALELLKKSGFDDDIIEQALAIKQRLTRKK